MSGSQLAGEQRCTEQETEAGGGGWGQRSWACGENVLSMEEELPPSALPKKSILIKIVSAFTTTLVSPRFTNGPLAVPGSASSPKIESPLPVRAVIFSFGTVC